MSFMETWEHERRGYVRCRTLGHSWHDYDSNWVPLFGMPLTVRCERCGMERRDTIDRRGDLASRRDFRPDKYLLKGERRPTRSDFRLILLGIREEEAHKAKRKRA